MKLGIVNDSVVTMTDEGIFTLPNAGGGARGLLELLEADDAARYQMTATLGSKIDGPAEFQAPLPRPSQLFAVGLNYRHHAQEMNLVLPTQPMVFTKFPSAVARPNASIAIPAATTDWESELVVVVGRSGRDIAVADALSHVAGYMVGQDISERTMQMASTPAQFSLGKSYENFAPMGPWLTTSDEVADPQNLRITCTLNGAVMQDSSTSDMVFTVAQIVSFISSICELRVGDCIFTGSPHGVGQGQKPPRFLGPGDELITTIESLGSITNRFYEPLASNGR